MLHSWIWLNIRKMNASVRRCVLMKPFCPYYSYDALPRSLSCSHRHKASQTPEDDKRTKRSKFSPAPTSKHDWIGPPDRLSNLRPIIYHIPENETPLERKLRHLRQETEDWNHMFWTNQNVSFSREKEEYIKSQLTAKDLTERDEKGRKRTLNSEEMAIFYKNFLDKNRERHISYNKEWYIRNFTITLLMARVALHNGWRTLTGQGRGRGKRKGHSNK